EVEEREEEGQEEERLGRGQDARPDPDRARHQLGRLVDHRHLPAAGTATGPRVAVGGAPSTPYSYGPGLTTGMRSKFASVTGVGTCHSSPREAHGFSAAGMRAKTSEQIRFPMKISIEEPST